MKPGDETPQNWQQPAENLSQAPYQTPVPQEPIQDAPINSTPIDMQSNTAELQQPSLLEPELETVAEEPYGAPENLQQEDSTDDTALLRWQATEYIDHERTSQWYIILAIIVLAFITLAIFVFNSITFAILIPVMLVSLVVYVRRPPSILNYILSRKGLHVNDHLFIYDQFKAFGIVAHEGTHSVVLLPRKRFQVSQTVYFPEEVGEPLVDMLAARLPMQEVKLDAIDRLLKKLRI